MASSRSHRRLGTTRKRYYYTSSKSFERSLDVYKPAIVSPENPDDDYDNDDDYELPLLVLVVGSAWLGHRSIIYSGTSWWNASGPTNLASRGFVTVCVRHRGSFPALPSLKVMQPFVTLVGASIGLCFGDSRTGMYVSIGLIALWGSWYAATQGKARFDDMLNDVGDALKWVRSNRDLLVHPRGGTNEQKRLVFGGYSSGGHVAASLLQRPDLLRDKGLPTPTRGLCDGAFFVSGVLSARPPLPATTSSSAPPRRPPPRWFTDSLLTVVFGSDGAEGVPSPLHGPLPSLPHLLVGCRNEVFGWNVMDLFFSSEQFASMLRKSGVSAKFCEVRSDHWRILNSDEFGEVSRRELMWLVRQIEERERDEDDVREEVVVEEEEERSAVVVPPRKRRGNSAPCSVCRRRYCVVCVPIVHAEESSARQD